jgi:cytochrome c-type biogenesis protein CcmH/NrfG
MTTPAQQRKQQRILEEYWEGQSREMKQQRLAREAKDRERRDGVALVISGLILTVLVIIPFLIML